MNRYRIEFLDHSIPPRAFSADRFNVYGQGRIAFYVDTKTEGFFGGVRSEIVAEISTHIDFIVEKL